MPIQATRLETEEDVQRALRSLRPGAVPKAPVTGAPGPADDAPPFFRPALRSPTPILTICDDGLETGETVRIRKKEFVIGRTDGDLTIPHDGQMSSRHAAIKQTTAKDSTRWSLVDLESTNGTFVRVSQAILEDGSEVIVGRTRLRFENKSSAQAVNSKPASVEQTTQLWQPAPSTRDTPAIVEVTNDGSPRRVLLTRQELWIGKDAAHCQMVLPADPFASARHARIRCNEEGRWIVENNKSVNGVWLKVDQIVFKDSCRFLLGEQVFLVQVP